MFVDMLNLYPEDPEMNVTQDWKNLNRGGGTQEGSDSTNSSGSGANNGGNNSGQQWWRGGGGIQEAHPWR